MRGRRVARTGLLGELLGFAAAGSCAYVTDLVLFVWLRGPVGLDPLSAKAWSFVVACTVAYAGNALITYRDRGRDPDRDRERGRKRDPDRDPEQGRQRTEIMPGPGRGPGAESPRPTPARLRRYALFLAVNLAGALVQLLCIAVTHYGLGLTSAQADTVSGAGVGMALATVLRFWGTRTLVFGTAALRPGHPGEWPKTATVEAVFASDRAAATGGGSRTPRQRAAPGRRP
jgi:putative flippase GtrA